MISKRKINPPNIIFSLIAFIGFFGLIYFWYQYESAKKMAELEEIRKLKIGEQNKTEKQKQEKIISKQENTEKDKKKAVIAAKKTQKTIPLATASEQQNIETEKKKAVSPVNNNQKTTSSVITKVFCSRFNVNTVLKGKELHFCYFSCNLNKSQVDANMGYWHTLKGKLS